MLELDHRSPTPQTSALVSDNLADLRIVTASEHTSNSESTLKALIDEDYRQDAHAQVQQEHTETQGTGSRTEGEDKLEVQPSPTILVQRQY